MVIRKAEQKDFKECYEIYSYYVKNTLYTMDLEPPVYEDYFNKLSRIIEEFPFFVCVDGEAVTGYAYLDHFNPKKGYDITSELTIYLRCDKKQRGYGTKLLECIEKEAKAMGKRSIVSLITSENPASILFHLKRGFEPQGDFPRIARKKKKYVGLTILRKNIYD